MQVRLDLRNKPRTVKIKGAKVPPPFLLPKMFCQTSPTPNPDAKNLFTIE